jgi:predicted PurR-regulated permease PerM
MSGEKNLSNRQLLVILFLLVFGAFLFYALSSLLTAFLAAIIFFVLLNPLQQSLVKKRKWNKNAAAIVIMLVSFMVILLPMLGIGYMLATKVSYVLNHTNEVMNMLGRVSDYVREKTGYDILSQQSIRQLQEWGKQILPEFLGQTLKLLTAVSMMYFMLFFFLIADFKVEEFFKSFLPFGSDNAPLFAGEMVSMVRSTAIGTPLIAIIQGIFAGVGYWIFGLNEIVFWAAVSAFFSFIPFVGAALIWFPAAVYLMITQPLWQGIGLLIYGAVVVTNVDNVFRFSLQKKMANIHPVITVLGVILGLNLFGIPGLIFGPLLISYFLLMIKIYRKEYL